MEAKLARIKELIEQRETIDLELEGLINGGVKETKPRLCKTCGLPGHNAKSCTAQGTLGTSESHSITHGTTRGTIEGVSEAKK